MLVATPGQTSYSIVHNNSSNGTGGNGTAATTSTTKKASTINSTSITASGAAKSLSNNNNHTTSTVTTKNSLNSNTHTTTFNYHQHPKSDNIVSNKISNHNKATASSSREVFSSTITAAPNSSKTENSTSSTNTKQSFIQTLKDSVQKALISTTGSSSNNSISSKYLTDNKLQKKCNNYTTSSIHNVTSSSSSTSHNANKVSTTTSNTSNNSTAATQSSSSVSVVRNKYLSCSLSKLHTVAPTVIHRYPEERQHTSSTDSLQKEMCHFKPIRIVPKTPWKSGSKSRGNSLRFPKANLATKNTDFVLKSNCDVNNRKKKQQQNLTQNDQINVDEDDVDDNEQENKEFHGIYKPKPSLTCLSTSVTTPNHQSAFVCLVSQMKNLVNLQSKRQLIPAKCAGAVVEISSGETLKELYMRKKPKPTKRPQKEVKEANEWPKVRGSRLTAKSVKNRRVSNETATQNATKDRVKRTNANTNNISKAAATMAITKAKSRRNLGRAKSKTTNMAATKPKERLRNSISMPAVVKSEAVVRAIKSARKRKIAQDVEDLHHQELLSTSSSSLTKTSSVKSLSLGVRKSVRLSAKDLGAATNRLYNCPTNINFQQTTANSSQIPRKNQTSVARFSPILTRSRLKYLAEHGKIVSPTATNIKKHKI